MSPLSAQQCFKPPPLFLVFMITKITTGLISWESERLWATLQEWHCRSVCKFVRGKLYISQCIQQVQSSTISLHILMLCGITCFSRKHLYLLCYNKKLTICFRCKILNVFLIWFITYAKSWLHANRQPLIRMNWKTNIFFSTECKTKRLTNTKHVKSNWW